MAEGALESARLLRWSGLALVAGGVLLAVATPLHPSRETATTIIASEVRLVASHILSTLSSLLILLGLPGLYATHRGGMGRLGLAGFFNIGSGLIGAATAFVLFQIIWRERTRNEDTMRDTVENIKDQVSDAPKQLGP